MDARAIKQKGEPIEDCILVAHVLVDPELARLPEAEVLKILLHPGVRALAAEQLQAILDGEARTADEILEGLTLSLAVRIRENMRKVLGEPEASQAFRLRCQAYQQRLARLEEAQVQEQIVDLGREIAARRKLGWDSSRLQPLLDEHLRLTHQKRALALARRGRGQSG
jgi:hypothetical protein